MFATKFTLEIFFQLCEKRTKKNLVSFGNQLSFKVTQDG